MLDEKDLQAIAEMTKGMESRIDQKLEKQKQEILDESARRMELLLDTEVTTRFNLLAEGRAQAGDPHHESGNRRTQKSAIKYRLLGRCWYTKQLTE